MALTFAIQDLKTSWKWYRMAYEREMEDEERAGRQKNLDLLNEFMKYALRTKSIRRNSCRAELIILPTDDSELYEYNKKTADKMMSKGKR